MASFKNVSKSTVIIAKHTILPDAVFSDDRYVDKEKASINKFVNLGYLIPIVEEAPKEEAPVAPAVEEALVAEEVVTTKKKSSKARG